MSRLVIFIVIYQQIEAWKEPDASDIMTNEMMFGNEASLPETVPTGTKVIATDIYERERADELDIKEGDIITGIDHLSRNAIKSWSLQKGDGGEVQLDHPKFPKARAGFPPRLSDY